MSTKLFHWFVSLSLLLGLFMATPLYQPARAAGPWYVAPAGDDSNDCLSANTPCATINGAMGKASAGDIVKIAVGTYTGAASEVVLVDRNITLSGGWNNTFSTQSGLSAIDGQGARRGMYVNGGLIVTVDGFMIQNGQNGGGGGGIFSSATILTLNDSLVTNNKVDCGFSCDVYGGGIYNNSGTMIINNTTISHNTADGPGGGLFNYGGVLTLNNSVLFSNAAGANYWGGGMYGNGTMILNNSTVSGNTVIDGSGGGVFAWQNGPTALSLNNSTVTGNMASLGGGIAADQTALSPFLSIILQNSVIASNTAVFGPDCWSPVSDPSFINSSGYNLIGNTSDCDFTSITGDLTSIDPLLGPLQDNGGLTFTHALFLQSPAIDAGNPAGCADSDSNLLTTDQRGVTRPQGARCDIGAFELEASGGGGNELSIDIRPGSISNIINRKSRGKIAVAILSTPAFDALSMLDRTSLTFGKTGAELSLAFCNKGRQDVNGDGLPDLVCHFNTQMTAFATGDIEGILKGKTLDNISMEGSDVVRIVK